jgi:hypothetical protein
MDNKKERSDKAKSITGSLKSGLDDRGTKLRCFLDDFYLSNVNPFACSEELYDHSERFKSSSKRNAEVAALYSAYFSSKYHNSDSVSKEDREAAWELKVELSTRVSSVGLSKGIGCNTSALSSLHSLFDTWRSIARNGGVKSQKFLKHSKTYFDDNVRPFTSKWHAQLNDSAEQSEMFRGELEQLQIETRRYCEKLETDFFIV